MYPFVIIWATEQQKEQFDESSYGHVDELQEIDEIIYKHVNYFIVEHKEKIQREMKESGGTITFGRFCEMVNAQPYWDFFFITIKYFDSANKVWKNYDIDENKLICLCVAPLLAKVGAQ